MAVLAVVPSPAVTAAPLYLIEDHLAALIETAELLVGGARHLGIRSARCSGRVRGGRPSAVPTAVPPIPSSRK